MMALHVTAEILKKCSPLVGRHEEPPGLLVTPSWDCGAPKINTGTWHGLPIEGFEEKG